MVIMVVVVAAAVALVGFTYIGLITNLKYDIFTRHILAGFSVLNFCRQVDTTSLLCVQFMRYMQCTHVKLLGVFLFIVKLCEKWVGKGLLIR
jgi:NADH:ubiquinone oxidoreductase subunit K